jgi:PKD repeat protein
MKNFTLFLAGILFAFTGTSFGQSNNWCGTDGHTHQLMQDNNIDAQQLHERVMRIVEHTPSQNRVGPYTIPVVFHILHDNGIGNISQIQLQSALDVLNEDYNRLNADSVNWRNTANAPFQPNVGNVQITFKLAKRDPNNNCTNGIVRVNAPHLTYNAGDDVKNGSIGGSDSWDVDKYMNIWVVNSIEGSGGTGTTLGYATLPYLGINANTGIVVRHDFIGKNGVGTSNSDGRTLTHEGGHYLGLLHTFQGPFFGGTSGCHTTDCNQNGDYICDTPPADIATFTCNLNLNTCTGTPPLNSVYATDVNDMIENYMSYDECQNMFSDGQKNRIWSVLDSASFPEYNNLVSASNATFTGINLPDVLCTADFVADNHIICAGETVNFSDESFNLVTSRTWSFPGGTPSSLTDSVVSVVYSTPGIYDVSISVTDGVTTVDSSRTGYIIVLDNPGNRDSLADSFEDYTVFPDYDKWVNESAFSNTFEITSSASVTGTKSLKLPIHGFSGIRVDELISGVYDFSTAPVDSNFYINYKYAYKNSTSNSSSGTNYLKLFISLDCGETWLARQSIIGSNFGNGVSATDFTPTATDWIEEELELPVPAIASSNFRFKFVISTEDAGNFYLEDVNVYVSDQTHLNTSELIEDNQIQMYPNPANNKVTLDFSLRSAEYAGIDLIDLSGRKVKTLWANQKIDKNEKLSFNVSAIQEGVYFVRIYIRDHYIVRKLVIE